MSIKSRKEFGRKIESVLKDRGISKKTVAQDIGIGLTTMYRIIHGATRIDKPTIAALVRSINRIAGSHTIDENDAMITAGYKLNGYARDASTVRDSLAELIATHSAKLPESVQEDILTMIRALEKKHTVPKRAAVGK